MVEDYDTSLIRLFPFQKVPGLLGKSPYLRFPLTVVIQCRNVLVVIVCLPLGN